MSFAHKWVSVLLFLQSDICSQTIGHFLPSWHAFLNISDDFQHCFTTICFQDHNKTNSPPDRFARLIKKWEGVSVQKKMPNHTFMSYLSVHGHKICENATFWCILNCRLHLASSFKRKNDRKHVFKTLYLDGNNFLVVILIWSFQRHKRWKD